MTTTRGLAIMTDHTRIDHMAFYCQIFKSNVHSYTVYNPHISL